MDHETFLRLAAKHGLRPMAGAVDAEWTALESFARECFDAGRHYEAVTGYTTAEIRARFEENCA